MRLEKLSICVRWAYTWVSRNLLWFYQEIEQTDDVWRKYTFNGAYQYLMLHCELLLLDELTASLIPVLFPLSTDKRDLKENVGWLGGIASRCLVKHAPCTVQLHYKEMWFIVYSFKQTVKGISLNMKYCLAALPLHNGAKSYNYLHLQKKCILICKSDSCYFSG